MHRAPTGTERAAPARYLPPVPLTEGRAPVIVVDGEIDVARSLRDVVVPRGWTRREGFELPARPADVSGHRWICVGVIADEPTAQAALGALLRGAGLVVVLRGASRFRLRVLDDLHHNGDVVIGGGLGGPLAALSPDDEALLAALADGSTVEQAARQSMLSLRTAQRRLAAIRDTYRAANTTEAVARWLAERERGPGADGGERR